MSERDSDEGSANNSLIHSRNDPYFLFVEDQNFYYLYVGNRKVAGCQNI